MLARTLRRRWLLATPLAALTLLLTTTVGAQAPSAVRIDGDSPAAFSVALSQEIFADAGEVGGTAFHAVLGRDDVFADSLAAGALLGGGPLFYVPGGESGTLPAEVAAELQRILPPGSLVYIAGGVAAVSQGIEDAVAELGYVVTRLAGEERPTTATAIAAEAARLNGDPARILVALAGNWPDAVAGGALAASESHVIVLTDGATLSPAAEAFIGEHPNAEVVILGGTAVISEAVATAAGSDLRLSGDTRADTAAAIANAFGEDVTGAVVMQGFVDDGWIMGNAGATLLQPLLLNGPDIDAVNVPTDQALDGHDGPLYVLGGTDRISDDGLAAVEAAR